MSKPQLTDSEKIVAIQKILEKHEVWSGETIAQSDTFYENSVEIVSDIADIVGWAKCPYDDEEEEDEESESLP